MLTLRLQKRLRRAIEGGHPWIYRDALAPAAKEPEDGALLRIVDEGGQIGFGWYSQNNPIAVRMLMVGDKELAPQWLSRKVQRAIALRLAERSLEQTNGWRLMHGESDWLPGLVVDRYDDALSVYFDGNSAYNFWQPKWPQIQQAIEKTLTVRSVWHKVRGQEPRLVQGTADKVVISEFDCKFEVDIARGHKTGFYLDQRANRVAARQYCADARVLNLFSYTGGFSVHAARAGALQVTSVDISKPAIAQAQAHFELNQLAGDHEVVATDARDFLGKARAASRLWDVVIVDPPNFAPNEKAKNKAMRAYVDVNAEALKCVTPGGHWIAASCSSHIDSGAFATIVERALARVGRRARLLRQTGAAADHPTLVGFAHSHYLQCCFMMVE